MSLINEVLRNLEESRPDDPARQNMQREIRALPQEKKGRGRALLWGGLGGLSVVAVGALMMTDAPRSALVRLAGSGFSASAPVPAAVPIQAPAQMPAQGNINDAVAPAVLGEAMLPQLQLDLASNDVAGSVPLSPVTAPSSVTLPVAPVAVPAAPVAAVPQTAAQVGVQPKPAVLPAANVSSAAVLAPAQAPNLVSAVPAPAVVAPVPQVAVPPAVVTAPPPHAVAPSPMARIEKTVATPAPKEVAEQEYRRAESLIAAGQLDLAAAGLAQALKLDPGHLPARQKLIHLQLTQRKNVEAMALLESGLRLSPNQSGWAISLARLQLDQGDLGAAIRTLEKSRPFAENRADYLGFLGHLKSRSGEQAEAAKYYMNAARLSPGEGRWWLGLGLALAAENRHPEAAEAFSQAVATGTLSGDLLRMAQQKAK
jgi:MSHA biogenesis protein MshN